MNDNDPANSALILVVLANATLESDALLRDYDTLAAVLATSLEVTNANYARKTLTDADLATYTVDDTNNRIVLTLPTQTFTAIGAGDAWRKLVVCYDSDTTAGTDTNIIPVKFIDLLIEGTAVVPNGSNILVSFPDGFHVSS